MRTAFQSAPETKAVTIYVIKAALMMIYLEHVSIYELDS